MKLKESLKFFFKPQWEKIILFFALDFLIAFIILAFGEEMSNLQLYIFSPSVLYLESVINPLNATKMQISINGAISSSISLFYLYFLSCLLINISEIIIRKIGRRK